MVGERIERRSKENRGLTAFEKGRDVYGTCWTFSILVERVDCLDRHNRRFYEEDEPAGQILSNVLASSQIPPGLISLREMTRIPLSLHLMRN